MSPIQTKKKKKGPDLKQGKQNVNKPCNLKNFSDTRRCNKKAHATNGRLKQTIW